MSNLMPEIEREWPAHLEPIRTEFGPIPTKYPHENRHRDGQQPAVVVRNSRGRWRKTLVKRPSFVPKTEHETGV